MNRLLFAERTLPLLPFVISKVDRVSRVFAIKDKYQSINKLAGNPKKMTKQKDKTKNNAVNMSDNNKRSFF